VRVNIHYTSASLVLILRNTNERYGTFSTYIPSLNSHCFRCKCWIGSCSFLNFHWLKFVFWFFNNTPASVHYVYIFIHSFIFICSKILIEHNKKQTNRAGRKALYDYMETVIAFVCNVCSLSVNALFRARWWPGLVVARWSRSTKLPYAGPG